MQSYCKQEIPELCQLRLGKYGLELRQLLAPHLLGTALA
jgi:hypothetical protein